MKQAKDLLVLAGGFGTRLRSAVSDVPKALAPVAGQPFLHYLIENWLNQGVTRLVFLLHHQAALIENFLDKYRNLSHVQNCEIVTVTEPQPLGTGGAVAFAVRTLKLQGSFMVANADTWLGSGIQQISNANAPAVSIVNVKNAGRYGLVQVSGGQIKSFSEKDPTAKASWINAGLYHLESSIFDKWNEKAFSLERDMFPKLAQNEVINAVALECDFVDIGIPEDYNHFCQWIITSKNAQL